MKIMVSGINGYIGSYLSSYLLKMGYEVHGIVRNLDNIDFLDKNIKIFNCNITEIENLEINDNYHLFIHLASANDIDSKDDKIAILDTVLGTKKVLSFCKKNNIRKLIYFSTFQVFGKEKGKINLETKLNCKNDYAITHYFAEEYIVNFSKNNDFNFIIARPTNIYGAPLSNKIKRDTLVPTCFCKDILEKSEIVLLSSGEQFRNFISLEEVSKYTIEIIEKFENYANQKLIFGSSLNISIKEMALITKKKYKKIYNKEITIQILNSEPKKDKKLQIDISPLPNLHFSRKNIKKEIKKIFEIMS